MLAQTASLTGVVLSAMNNHPIPGVSITVEGTSIGTISAPDGTFSLEIPENSTTLVFRHVGMLTETIDVDTDRPGGIEVYLEEDFLELEEVILTGYSSRTKNSLTGSTIQIGAEKFRDIPVTSVDQALQGKVAGLVVATTSGTPGSVQDIRIRGVGSLAAGKEPLIVVDGVPVINQNHSWWGSSSLTSLSALSSNDIESITVLKDASATAAYGARGSNGVIVISTRKGEVGKTSFTGSYSFGFQNKATQGKDVLTGAQREKLYLDGIYHSFGTENEFSREEAFKWALENGFPGAISYDEWHAEGSPESNWEEAMRNKNAPVMNFVFSSSGGDQSSTFYASAGYHKAEATVVGNEFRRINATLNYSRKLHKRVLFSTANKVSDINQNGVMPEQYAFYTNPHWAKYAMSPLLKPRNEDGSPKIDNPTILYNWLYLKDNDIKTNDLTRAISTSFLEWEVLKHLKYKMLFSLDYVIVEQKDYRNRHHGPGTFTNGKVGQYMERNSNIVFQNGLFYNLNVREHRIDFLALMEYQVNDVGGLSGEGENFLTDGLTNVGQAGSDWFAGSLYEDWMHLSYLGMINYSFQGKYYIDATYRREGSSKFPPDQRYGNFWSAGAAWNISREAFLEEAGWITNLRVRASFGVSGNSEIGINQFQALLSYDATYADQGAVYPSRYGNPLLTWEKNTSLDIGVDFGLFDGKVSGSFIYFQKETYDLLQWVPLTSTSGHSYVMHNVGSVLNRGMEGILNFDLIRSQELNLIFSANLATLDNEVTKLAKNADGDDIIIDDYNGRWRIEVGHPIHEWHMKTWAGVDPVNGDPLWYSNGISGDTTNEYSRAIDAYQGKSAIPTFTGGVGLHVDYKGIFLDVNAYFAGGHMVFEDNAIKTHDNGRNATDLFNGVADLVNSWTSPGQVTDFPKIYHAANPNNASHQSSRFLYDGDFARLKDVVLGYTLPASVVSKIRFSGIQVYFRGTNLATWVKDERLQYDPEVRADGITYLTTPPVKTLLVGININF